MLFLILLLISGSVSAQEPKKFSPEKFQAEMEEFIAKEAHLDQQEAKKYFAVLRELRDKQRPIYAKIRKKEKPADDAACLKTIEELDRANIELKQLDLKYHKKMMQEVAPSKVFDAIKAEGHFHRKMIKGWQHRVGDKSLKGKPKDKR